MKNQHDDQMCIRLCINPHCTICDAVKKYTKTAVYMLTLILNHGNLIESLQFLFWQSSLIMPYWQRENNFLQACATMQLESFYLLQRYLYSKLQIIHQGYSLHISC